MVSKSQRVLKIIKGHDNRFSQCLPAFYRLEGFSMLPRNFPSDTVWLNLPLE